MFKPRILLSDGHSFCEMSNIDMVVANKVANVTTSYIVSDL